MLAGLLLGGCAGQTPYVAVGAGYKFDEYDITWTNRETGDVRVGQHPISGRIEMGLEGENYRIGIDHHSQFFENFPFNDKTEYHKTEFFFDYVYKFKQL